MKRVIPGWVLVLSLCIGCDSEPQSDTILILKEGDSGVDPDEPTGSGMGNAGGEMGGPSMLPPEPLLVPEFGRLSERRILVQARRSDGLSHPRDLEFDPLDPRNLWVVDRDWDGNVILFDAGEPNQRIERMRDMAASHFMEEVSSIAFADQGNFGTCQESRNDYDGFGFPNDFMGPVLWSSDLMIHCNVNQIEGGPLNGGHLDMLHQSPNCMGMAHQADNAFFVADGANGHVVRYDFKLPHIPGGDDHSDGEVSRYPELTFTRVPDIPSHMQLVGNELYYADTGAGAIRVGDISTGSQVRILFPDNEPLALFNEIGNVQHRIFASGLNLPSGLLVTDDTVFISFPATGEIAAFDLAGNEIERIDTGHTGVMGLAMGPDGRLWFVNAYQGTVNVLEPGPMVVNGEGNPVRPAIGGCVYPEWGDDSGIGAVIPPYQWANAISDGTNIGDFSLVDVYCGPEWNDVQTIHFVVVPEWIPWLTDYAAYVDAIEPQIRAAGGRVIYVGAQDQNGSMVSSMQTNNFLREFTPRGRGIRVGDGENAFRPRLIDSNAVDHLPAAFVVRRSDMTIISSQRLRGANHLPYVEIAQNPMADWSDPGPPTIIPTYPSNCPDGTEEASEPNDSPDTAAVVGVGRFEGGVCGRRGDFYYVDLQGPWRAELAFSHSTGDLDVVFFANGQPMVGGNGQPQGANSSDDNEVFQWRGPLLFYIYGYDGATAPYILRIQQ